MRRGSDAAAPPDRFPSRRSSSAATFISASLLILSHLAILSRAHPYRICCPLLSLPERATEVTEKRRKRRGKRWPSLPAGTLVGSVSPPPSSSVGNPCLAIVLMPRTCGRVPGDIQDGSCTQSSGEGFNSHGKCQLGETV